jgi:hypothetical protein
MDEKTIEKKTDKKTIEKNDLGRLATFFTDKQNVEIKRELMSTIRSKTTGVDEMSEEKLDKTVKFIRYTLQLYDLSTDMNKKLKQILDEK